MARRATLFGLMAVALISSVTASGSQSKPVRSDQEILIQLEQDWDAAFQRHDARFVESVLADEFIATYSDGSRGDKAREVKFATEFNQQVDARRLDEFIVKVYRDTAVVWFTQHLIGPVQGRPVELTYRYMDVWVQRDGRWLCIASQSTKVTAPQA